MREWLDEWGAFARFILLCGVIATLVIGGLVYSVATSPHCHYVYVQTTPVNGLPAMERQEVCR